MSKLSSLLLIPALCGAVFAGGVDSPVSLRLKEAPADAVLESLARVLRSDLFLDTAGTRNVTLQLERIPVASALDRVCEQLGCHWELLPGDPPMLRVESLLSLELVQADLRQVLTLFAQILGVGIEIDPEVRASVTIRLSGVPWSDALDGLCDAAGCRWSLEAGTRRLRIERSDTPLPARDRPAEIELAGPQRSRPPLDALIPAAPAAVLRFDAPGSREPVVRRLELGWSRPTSRVASADGSHEVLTSWVGLGNRRDVLFSLLVDCGSRGARPRVHALDAVVLPIEESSIRASEGAVVEFLPGAPQQVERAESGAGESCVLWDAVGLNVRIDGVFNASNVIRRPGQSLQLLVIPTEERPASDVEAAVVVVDRDSHGRHELVLLWLSEDAKVETRRGIVAPGLPWSTRIALADGTTAIVEVEVVAAEPPSG